MDTQGTADARQSRGANGVLDDLSKRIIEQLQVDGRRSYASIAKDVGLSEAAVRQRVQRLVETGAMQIVAVTDPLQVGFQRQAMIGVQCSADPVVLADQIAQIEAVDYVVVTAGRFDLLVEVVCADDAELLDLVSHRIRSLPEVERSEIFVYLKLVKQHYDWGTR
ncbi:Lrp/AsnC family transcriptional regulator [Propioniciclava tarda]|uniref:Lrp/AsnC family transcriptional regulator n=1 Tax=Propioniciclava tarda TaxID=433330 RepID=A0A4Q9KMZ4_PROTD|nr:Lrp/AsnC family transcriptional regulator [Propioniciclava tarda]TBT95625.1 Lrp/AsnC family transcriptional regulator [Propioniciclava tarda]SMO47403.1 transcriptional regulator, AsnC family [Propioniciclava tarda]HOA89340.1 Lrp/AsnC family transcriptional regulator [Propioniciclava tarda]HQA31326.1 Lrp/AsnC family transcriptional regulator [Propioniciclava tarda]HQD61046.1 Lrp/AsnC family transcriptional regulator [Propioniciclava tarda]